MNDINDAQTFAARSSRTLDKIEALYLKVLRAVLLVVATVLLAWALIWAAINLTRVLRSPDSVVEKPSVVASSEILTANVEQKKKSEGSPDDSASREQRAYYDGFIKRYYSLYSQKYQPFMRGDDKRLSMGEFDDLTINTEARLSAIRAGELNFETDKNDLEAYLPIVADATSNKATTDKLQKYRNAKKQSVTTQIRRVRYENRRGWDSLSTYCAGWYESPIGCPVNRRVEVPYSERVTQMRYPEGVLSPNALLKSYQDRYFALLAQRRSLNSADAETEREKITAGNITGWAGLSQATMIAGAFLVLMFFFLLVAIERHQRRYRI